MRPLEPSRVLGVALLFASSTALTHNTEPYPEHSELTVGQSVTATQAADERKMYQFEALQGRSYLLNVEQNGLDLAVTITEPNGRAHTIDSPLRRDDREFFLIEDSTAGTHLITIYPNEFTGAMGSHTATIAELGDSVDALEREAWQLMTAGAVANNAGGHKAWQAAVTAYSRARNLWRSLGHARNEAQALYSVAYIEYWQRFNWTVSATLAEEAAALYSRVNEQSLFANALQLQAAALIERANEVEQSAGDGLPAAARSLFDQAIRLFDKAAAVQRELGRGYDLGQITNNIGLTHYYMGDFERAREVWQQAAEQFASNREWSAESLTLANLGVVDIEAGRLTRALATQERVVKLLPPGRNDDHRATALDNLGISYRLLGRLDDALSAHAKALQIHRAGANPNGEAISLLGIGQSYYAFGDFDLAEYYLKQVQPLARQTNDGRLQEAALRYLGNVAFITGRYQGTPTQPGAVELHEAALEHATSPSDSAYLKVLIAADLRELGRHGKALTTAEEAVQVAESTGSDMLLAMTLAELGRAHLVTSDFETATDSLEHAELLFEALDMRTERADALHSLSTVARLQGDLDLAWRHGDAALEQVESSRTEVADPELRALFVARHRTYYDSQIDLLMMQHATQNSNATAPLQAALKISERSRARSTADLVRSAAVDLRRTIDSGLAAHRTKLYEELAEASLRRRQARKQGSDQGTATTPRVDADREMADIETRLKLVEAEIRAGDPGYAALYGGSVLDPEAMQALLDDETALLQYALGGNKSYAWLVTRDSITAVALAGRRTIESAARAAFEALQTPRLRAGSRREVEDDLRQLSAQILHPLPSIGAYKRLIISADGALQYVPFGVLRPRVTAPRLVETTEIVNVPSLTVIDLQRRRKFAQPTKTLAIFADPVFSRSDPRLDESAPATSPIPSGNPALPTRSPFSDNVDLRRLPSTGAEARSISKLMPMDQYTLAVGLHATRDAVLKGNLGQYRFVHFATHGLIDSRYPALSALALSNFDASGRARNGLLRLPDIFTLDLNADLVALSACDTALGRDIRGEGLLGLTQGFLYAGTRSLVVSLWQVSDQATAELMKRMYRYLLKDGLRVPDALRRAQLELAMRGRWRDPYYWGAMTFIGDWRGSQQL